MTDKEKPGKKSVGRPRNNPDRLAQWKPPEDWVRVVAWVSPEERKALKRIALEADSSVAELIRSLASGLEHNVISAEELLSQIKKGAAVMEKIPTLFDRGTDFKVVDRVRAGCEWVVEGQGQATEKLDGMNVRLTIRSGQLVRLEKRRNPNKLQKKGGIVDGWYVDAIENSKEDQWIFEASNKTVFADWPDGEHPCEALGPKIQGNSLGLHDYVCVPFDLEIPVYEDTPRTFMSIREQVMTLPSKYSPEHLAEGIVFHHSDGRRAKIKRKDFDTNTA